MNYKYSFTDGTTDVHMYLSPRSHSALANTRILS